MSFSIRWEARPVVTIVLEGIMAGRMRITERTKGGTIYRRQRHLAMLTSARPNWFNVCIGQTDS
jgi:hypothetical protein